MLREIGRLLLDQGEECSRMRTELQDGEYEVHKKDYRSDQRVRGVQRVSHHLKQWFSKPGPYPAAAASPGNLSEIHILFKRFFFFLIYFFGCTRP